MLSSTIFMLSYPLLLHFVHNKNNHIIRFFSLASYSTPYCVFVSINWSITNAEWGMHWQCMQNMLSMFTIAHHWMLMTAAAVGSCLLILKIIWKNVSFDRIKHLFISYSPRTLPMSFMFDSTSNGIKSAEYMLFGAIILSFICCVISTSCFFCGITHSIVDFSGRNNKE